MKFKEKFEDLVFSKAIHCDTEEKAIELFKELDKLNVTWADGHSLDDDTKWWDYEENTCYVFDDVFIGLQVGEINFFTDNNFPVIEFDDLIAGRSPECENEIKDTQDELKAVAEELHKTMLELGISAKQAATALQNFAALIPAPTEEDIMRISMNPSLSIIQKFLIIRKMKKIMRTK